MSSAQLVFVDADVRGTELEQRIEMSARVSAGALRFPEDRRQPIHSPAGTRRLIVRAQLGPRRLSFNALTVTVA